jgi:hypothetical protein
MTYVDNDPSKGSSKNPIKLPDNFLLTGNKSRVLQFSLLNYINMTIELSISILNFDFHSHQNLFLNTTRLLESIDFRLSLIKKGKIKINPLKKK